MKQYLKFLRRVNFKSLRFNLKYLPLRDALRFPFLISNNIILMELNGNVILEESIKTGMIQIGYSYGGVGLFDKERSKGIWQVSGSVLFKGTARIGHGAKICVAAEGVLELGNNFAITAESSVVVKKAITFGNDCLVSWDCLFMDSDFHKIYDEYNTCINESEAIKIGDQVWIGCRNLVLKGSLIADKSIVGAHSVVNKKLEEPSSMYVGNPVRLIKKNVRWEA